MRVLMITSEWPTPDNPRLVPFIVRQVEFLRKANVSVDVFSFRGAKNPVNYAISKDLSHERRPLAGLKAVR